MIGKNIQKIALIGVGSDGWIGGIYYIMNILNALNCLNKNFEVHLYKSSEQNFPDLNMFNKIRIIEHDYTDLFTPNSLTNKIKSRLKKLFFKYKNPRIEGYLIRNKFDYVFPERLSSHNNKLNVGSWIADFQYINFPKDADKALRDFSKKRISEMASHAPKVILSSNSCEKECHQYYPKSVGKTHVMPFAVYINPELIKNNFQEIKEKYNLPEKYIVVSNLFAPTKNHETLFKALGELKNKGTRIPLFCTGNIVDSRNLHFANKILEMLTIYKIRDIVNILGLIPREDQIAIYRMCTAIIQPSLHEGWNTTVEETKALGINILLSDIDVHKEQILDSNCFFNKKNHLQLAEKLSILWKGTEQDTFPDPDKELNAILNYKENIKSFGENFIKIASK